MKRSIMKSGILLLLVTHFAAFLYAQESLSVHKIDGKNLSYLTRTIDKITFPGENMLITFKSNPSTNYLISEIQYCDFKYNTDWDPNLYPKYTILVFPNPTKNEISIKSAIPIYEVILYNVLGQKLTQVMATPDKTVLSLVNYPAGFYMLQIMTSAGMMSEKIIKN